MIAHYTRAIMRSLEHHGQATVSLSLGESRARMRLVNAARRLGVRISTTVDRESGCITARVL